MIVEEIWIEIVEQVIAIVERVIVEQVIENKSGDDDEEAIVIASTNEIANSDVSYSRDGEEESVILTSLVSASDSDGEDYGYESEI